MSVEEIKAKLLKEGAEIVEYNEDTRTFSIDQINESTEMEIVYSGYNVNLLPHKIIENIKLVKTSN